MLFKPGMEVAMDGGMSPFKTVIRGWKEGKYILAEKPGPSAGLKLGLPLVGRVFFDGVYHGFSTDVTGVLPESGLFASRYPDDIVETSVRKDERFKLVWPVTVAREKNSEFRLDGAILDISAGGCGFLSGMAFKNGEKAYLSAMTPGGKRIDGLPIEIRSMRNEGKRQVYGGLFSLNGDSVVNDAINSFLNTIKNYGLDETESDLGGHNPNPSSGNIEVGAKAIVQIGAQKLSTVFRGMTSKHTLIDAPIVGGRPLLLTRGDIITVRYASGGKIYTFESEIIRQYTSPSCFWAVNSPGPLRGVSLRKSPRVTVFIPGNIEDTLTGIEGALVNLSEGGGLFSAKTCSGIIQGLSYSLNLELPDGSRVTGLKCVVRSQRKLDEKSLIGFSFDEDGEPEALLNLRSYYNDCLRLLKN